MCAKFHARKFNSFFARSNKLKKWIDGWMNGWIVKNKYARYKWKSFAKFWTLRVQNSASGPLACSHSLSLIIAREARRGCRAKSRFANARELLYRYIEKQNNWLSQKRSVFDTWCMEQKMFVFTPLTLSRLEPARSDHDALWRLKSRKLFNVGKNFIRHKI